MESYNSCLLYKTCSPCQGEVPPLDSEMSSKLLLELKEGWVINKFGYLHKEYNFNNFMDAINFANKIAVVAEKEAHHPNLTISWGKCAVDIWTHKINGLTENDFILAKKIGAM